MAFLHQFVRAGAKPLLGQGRPTKSTQRAKTPGNGREPFGKVVKPSRLPFSLQPAWVRGFL